MADVSVAADAIGSPVLTLEPGEITTVTFSIDASAVEVIATDLTDFVRWTCDGTEPDADTGYYIPRSGAVDEREPHTAGPTVVKVWSAGNGIVVVQRADA